jgi:AcrR family transcriptional regulator
VAKRKPKGAYHHGDLRAALLDASSEILRQKGVAALTLRSVAARLGVSHAAPRHHFADKDALLSAVSARGFRRLADAMLEAAAGERDPVRRLELTGVEYVRFALAEPELFRLIFGRRDANVTPELAEAGARAYDVLVEEARGALLAAGGDLARLPAVVTAAWSLVHGLSLLLLDGRLPPPPDGDTARVAAEVTHLVAQALRS